MNISLGYSVRKFSIWFINTKKKTTVRSGSGIGSIRLTLYRLTRSFINSRISRIEKQSGSITSARLVLGLTNGRRKTIQ